MKLVHEVTPGVVELNWAWLPTWLGQNTAIKVEIEQHVHQWMTEQPQPLELNERNLEAIHQEVMSFLHNKFPEEPSGLLKFLEGLRYVQYGASSHKG